MKKEMNCFDIMTIVIRFIFTFFKNGNANMAELVERRKSIKMFDLGHKSMSCFLSITK